MTRKKEYQYALQIDQKVYMSKYLKALILTTAMLLTIALQSHSMMMKMCGDSMCATTAIRGIGFVSPGISWVDLDRFNNFLGSQGISSFNTMAPTLTIGGYKEMNNIIMESNLTLRYWQDNVKSNLRTSLFMGDLDWNAGINLMKSSMPLCLFPYVGAGVGLNSLHMRSNKKSLGALLVSSDPNAMLWQAAFLLNVGVGSNYLFPRKNAAHGLALGLRAGYQFDPISKNRDWHSGGTNIVDLPTLKQSGPYLRLVLGGWGSSPKEACSK